MSNEYQLTDGTPRYGSRSEAHTAEQTAATPVIRVEETAEAAARLGLNHMAAAIHRRLTSSWADKENPLVAGLRNDHPEELAAARVLVKLHLCSQRQWRLKAQTVRDTRGLHHAPEPCRRQRQGDPVPAPRAHDRPDAPPVYVVATSHDDILKLVLTGAACIAAALIGGHFITVRSRIPAMRNIRGAWLKELREDVVNATLIAILQNRGVPPEAKAGAAGKQGWQSISAAAKAVDALQN